MAYSPNPSRGAVPEPEGYLVGRWFAAARRRGFLAAVPPEPWHTLCALLSFTCRDGRRLFTADQLALSLAVPRVEAERRLADLERAQWHGQPLASLERDADGAVCGAALAPADLLLRPVSSEAAPATPAALAPPLPPVEGSAPGSPPPSVPPGEGDGTGDLGADLEEAGLTPEQSAWILTTFPEERVRRQLRWLPQRGARNPAAFLVRAVENDWSAPKEARREAP
jgi:hypothetical protein